MAKQPPRLAQTFFLAYFCLTREIGSRTTSMGGTALLTAEPRARTPPNGRRSPDSSRTPPGEGTSTGWRPTRRSGPHPPLEDRCDLRHLSRSEPRKGCCHETSVATVLASPAGFPASTASRRPCPRDRPPGAFGFGGRTGDRWSNQTHKRLVRSPRRPSSHSYGSWPVSSPRRAWSCVASTMRPLAPTARFAARLPSRSGPTRPHGRARGHYEARSHLRPLLVEKPA